MNFEQFIRHRRFFRTFIKAAVGVNLKNAKDILCRQVLSQLPKQVVELGEVKRVFDLLTVTQEERACVDFSHLCRRD